MKEIAEWLVHIEQLAGGLYRGAARRFRDDERLSGFLSHLADEEAWHGEVMGHIVSYLDRNGGTASAVALDDAVRVRIEAPFLDCGERLQSDTLRREHMINCIAAAEFSEWNDLFVYVMNALKEAKSPLKFTAAKMQAHKRSIESFIESLPEGKAYLPLMRKLKPVWEPRILIVEPDPDVRELLSAVLGAEGTVETATDGRKALEKTKGRYFDAVITESIMPAMSGIDFYREAAKRDAGIGERFLFLTSRPTDELNELIRENKVLFLPKPMRISVLTNRVREVLNATSGQRGRSGTS